MIQLHRPHFRRLCLIEGNMNGRLVGGIKSNNLPAMIYIIFESINPATRVGVSNIKNEIDRATLDNFFNDI